MTDAARPKVSNAAFAEGFASLFDVVQRGVRRRATAAEIGSASVHSGARTLRDDGIDKILAGITTISEVERVTVRADDGEQLKHSAVSIEDEPAEVDR